jgi:hypothetical protein
MIIKTKAVSGYSLHVIIALLTIIILPGCQKVITVDLNVAAPRIVIEGMITDRAGPYTVKISKLLRSA